MSEPTGPTGNFFLGSILDFYHDPVGFSARVFRDHGDFARFRFLHMPCYQVVLPDDIREVLVDPQGAFTKGMALEGFRPLVGRGILLNEGDSHRRQRRLMQPAFHRDPVLGYGRVMAESARGLAARWTDGAEVDMAHEMTALTLDIAVKTLFGSTLRDSDVAEVSEAIAAFAAWYHQSVHPMGPLLQLLPSALNRRFTQGRAALDRLADRMIAEARARPPVSGRPPDILSILLAARDTEGDGQGMDEQVLRDEVRTLLIAGHETTAAALSWAWYLLATHPEVARALEAEVEGLGHAPEMTDLPRLPVAEGVFGEALRLYPPAHGLVRQAQKPLTLHGHPIQKGDLVMVGLSNTHRDPRWWPNPEEVRPERWRPEARAARPKFAFVAFGGGARTCIGESFAWAEGTLVLATLAQHWRVSWTRESPAEHEAYFTLRPKGGLPMRLVRR